MQIRFMFILTLMILTQTLYSQNDMERKRTRDLGIVTGDMQTGKLNTITDVAGVMVGHKTIIRGDSVRTGVTAILPHTENIFREKVPGAIVVFNGFGKLAGYTQVEELGNIETPIILTNTLSVPTAAKALIKYTLLQPGNENVRSVNPVVGETNDGDLNDIRGMHVSEQDVLDALHEAKEGKVAEGCVGAGTGTTALGFKGGIGTSSRVLPETLGGWTVGVLVQSNFGGVLSIAGAPVGRELGRYYLQGSVGTDGGRETGPEDLGDGSIMIVVATDAPLDHRNLQRLGRRALAGLARTGSSMTNGSGDFVIAFSTVRVADLAEAGPVPNDQMSPMFQAVIEATEEAIYNSLFLATTVVGYRGVREALPIDSTLAVLRRYGVVRR